MPPQNSLAVELLGKTRASILYSLLDKDGTVPEISRNLSLIEPGVRRHLDYMQSIGIVSSFFKQAGRGRPKKYYRITSNGRSLLPKMYDEVLSSILLKLNRRDSSDGEKLSDKLLNEVASELADEFKLNTESLNTEDKLRAFEDFLNSMGFSSRVEMRSDGTVSILRSDCALYNVALKNYRTVCLGFDRILVSKCLNAGSEVKLECCMALGKGRCEHIVRIRTSV